MVGREEVEDGGWGGDDGGDGGSEGGGSEADSWLSASARFACGGQRMAGESGDEGEAGGAAGGESCRLAADCADALIISSMPAAGRARAVVRGSTVGAGGAESTAVSAGAGARAAACDCAVWGASSCAIACPGAGAREGCLVGKALCRAAFWRARLRRADRLLLLIRFGRQEVPHSP